LSEDSSGGRKARRGGRVELVKAVQTPLGFFVLVVLIVEVGLGVLTGLTNGYVQTVLVFGMIGTIILLVLIVAGIAVYRPEALRGLRRGDNVPNPAQDEGHSPTPATFFSSFMDAYEVLFRETDVVTCFFIHSRRWRDSCLQHVEGFLRRANTKLILILPDLRETGAIDAICSHFVDGASIPVFIQDAYRYYHGLQEEFPGKVEVRLYTATYPTYTIYHFGSKALIAMYPTVPRKADVPAFLVSRGDPFWDFIGTDLKDLLRDSCAVSHEELRSLATQHGGA